MLAGWHASSWQVLAELAVLGTGFGLATGATGTLVSELAHPGVRGIAVGMNSVLRMTGGGFGSQIAAAVLAFATVAGSPSAGAFTLLFWLCSGVAAIALALVAAIPG